MAKNIEHRGEIKQNATPVIYFNLLNSGTEANETGIAAITVYYSKNGGAATNLAAPTFAEISAANMPGVYKLTLDAAMTDTLGELLVYITAAGCHDVKLACQVVANIASDIYSRMGAPAGASVSADIADLNTDVAALNTKLGTPAGADISTDIATIDAVVDAVKVKTDQLNFTGANVNANSVTADLSNTAVDKVRDGVWAADQKNVPYRSQG